MGKKDSFARTRILSRTDFNLDTKEKDTHQHRLSKTGTTTGAYKQEQTNSIQVAKEGPKD